jgi:hypothetical protein
MDLATQNAPSARFSPIHPSQVEDVLRILYVRNSRVYRFSLYFDAPSRSAAAATTFI